MLKLLFAAFATLCSLEGIAECPSAFNSEIKKLHSKETVNLCELYDSSKAMVIVNTASHCGYTKQFSGLEALNKKYAKQGLVIVGFPSNSFKQEEKDEEATAEICYQNYGVTFVMAEHTDVKGDHASSAFKYLAQQTEAPSWNFNKYLIDSRGKVSHYGSATAPLESELEQAITSALKP
jgi:glutathione peroxidase